MKLYDVNKIFIAAIGYVKKNDFNATIKNNEYVFVISNSDCTNKNFIDVFSKQHYKYFSYGGCEDSDLAMFNQETLIGFVAKMCKKNKKLQNLSIIKKIINGELLNENELKTLLFAINNKNAYKILANISNSKNEKQIKNNYNIKLNYVTTLSNKKYKLQPIVGRDNELKQVLTSILQNKKASLLIGERGVGKTSIIDEIVYKIQKNDIPYILRNKNIIELNLNVLLIDSEPAIEKITKLIETAIKDNLIIFIDGIDTISDCNILKLFKYAIEKNNLKVIATINSKNDNKLYTDDIFNRIIVNEPNEEELTLIVSKILNDYSKINNIKLGNGTNEELTKILINLTKTENRIISNTSNKPINYDLQNPGLIVEIIDRMFADAIINSNKELKLKNIIYGISSCDRIKEDVINETINYLNSTYKNTKSITPHKAYIFSRKK